MGTRKDRRGLLRPFRASRLSRDPLPRALPWAFLCEPFRLGRAASFLLDSVVAVTLLAVASNVRAADPQLGRIAPCGGQRGTEIDVVLSGARLGDAREIMLYYPGIRVVKLEPQKDGSVKVRLAIAPDCRLGLHAFRVRTATGISNLLQFSVGSLPEIQEIEPNSEFDKPQKIPLNVTVNGVVENEDVDYFVVEAKNGQRIAAEIEGVRLGEAFFDPYLAILDTGRFVLAGADDTPLVYQDSAVSAIVPKDGSYVIQLRESAFGGSSQCRYRLHVGTFPRPLAACPYGGKPGQALDVRWLGDVAGEWIQKITLPAAAQPMFGLAAQNAQGVAPSLNPFRISDLNNVIEVEPNDAPVQATASPAPAAFNGVISKPGDADCFKFPAKPGQVFDVRVFARSMRSPLDSVLTVSRANGAAVAASDDTDTPDSYVRFTAPADEQYIITIRDHMLRGGPEFAYRVEVTPVQPKLTMNLPERTAYVDITCPVPAGNRVALMVGAQREDFGGPLKLEIKDLPAGISAEILPMGADETAVPVLLTAAADAKPGGSLADLIGRTEGNPPVVGHLRQRTSLVRGANNREVWNHWTERMAVAVTERIPFHVEIVEPKAPIVQSGSMELKIVATRDPAFKAPITVQMLHNPPGVSTPATVTIPEGAGEVILPLTADGGAAVRKWKIAVLATAAVGGGAVTVSSQLANLEVAEPFVRFAFNTTSVDQGQQTDLAIKIERKRDFPGKAKVELLGLPHEVTAPPQEITKDSTQIVFPVKTTAKSPVGQHKTLLCRAVMMVENQPVTHMLGTGELRIEKPLPPKPAQVAKPQASPPPPPVKPVEKTLTRLEKLRLERAQSPPGEKK